MDFSRNNLCPKNGHCLTSGLGFLLFLPVKHQRSASCIPHLPINPTGETIGTSPMECQALANTCEVATVSFKIHYQSLTTRILPNQTLCSRDLKKISLLCSYVPRRQPSGIASLEAQRLSLQAVRCGAVTVFAMWKFTGGLRSVDNMDQ